VSSYGSNSMSPSPSAVHEFRSGVILANDSLMTNTVTGPEVSLLR
jgi:hypothetical protein